MSTLRAWALFGRILQFAVPAYVATQALYAAWRIYVRGDNNQEPFFSNEAALAFFALYAAFRALILVLPLPVWLIAWRHEGIRSWRSVAPRACVLGALAAALDLVVLQIWNRDAPLYVGTGLVGTVLALGALLFRAP
jgi:hypothetical protein